MKKFYLGLFLMLAMALAAFAQQAQPQAAPAKSPALIVAVVDLPALIKVHPVTVDEVPMLQEQFKKDALEAQKTQQNYQKEMEKVSREYNIGTPQFEDAVRPIKEGMRNLEAQMQEASENLDFEKAAVYRDRLNALRAVMANQNVSFPRESDRDAVGFFRDAGEMCFRKLELREGRIIGSSTYFLKDEGETEESLLEAFLMQYYPTAAEIPKAFRS